MATRQHQSMLSNLLAMATMVIALALLILAVLRWRDNGWGGLIWLASFIAMCIIRTPHSMRNRVNVVVDARKDITEIMLLAAMFIAMMILPLVHLAIGVFRFADYQLPEWATWSGAIAQLPFLWLFWRSHADLGRNWSPGLEVRQDHSLITNGVYARIRHPMYAAIWIAALAQPLLIHNWIAGAFIVPAFAAMWLIRVPNEETMMHQRFGAVWEDYCGRTGRILPKRAT